MNSVAERLEVGACLGRRAELGLSDELDQWHAGSIEVDARVRAAIVDRLAGVLELAERSRCTSYDCEFVSVALELGGVDAEAWSVTST